MKDSRSTARQLRDTLAWNVVALSVGLVAGILTARLLMPEGKGLLALVLSTVSLTVLAAGLGTNVSVRVFLPSAQVTLRSYWFVSCVLTIIAATASLLAIWGIGSLVDSSVLSLPYIVIGVWLGIVMFLGNQLLDLFNAIGRNSYSAFLNAFVVIAVVLALLPALFVRISLLYVLIVYAGSYSLRVVIALISLRGERLFRWESVVDEARLLVLNGIPLLGLNVGQALTYRMDQLVLGAVRSAHEVGVYAVAATPASAGQVISNSVGQVVFRKVATGEFRRRQVLVASLTVFALTGGFALVLYLVAPWLVPLLFGTAYQESVPLLRLLVIAEVCLAPYMVLSRAAAGAKMISVAGWSGAIGLVLMFATLSVLVPLWGADGAAIACIITYLCMTLFTAGAIVFGRWENERITGSS